MRCPICNGKIAVINTRTTPENHVKRTRACYHCGNVFDTFEMPDTEYVLYKRLKNKNFNG